MRKITELSHGNFTAKVYRDCLGEYRVKFYHAGSQLPVGYYVVKGHGQMFIKHYGDYFTHDESDARGTAALCMQHMADNETRDNCNDGWRVE